MLELGRRREVLHVHIELLQGADRFLAALRVKGFLAQVFKRDKGLLVEGLRVIAAPSELNDRRRIELACILRAFSEYLFYEFVEVTITIKGAALGCRRTQLPEGCWPRQGWEGG